MRKGEELKAFRYASAAVTRDYITTRDIIPNIISLAVIYMVICVYNKWLRVKCFIN